MAQGMCAPGLSCIFVFFDFHWICFFICDTQSLLTLDSHQSSSCIPIVCMIQELHENLGRDLVDPNRILYIKKAKNPLCLVVVT